MPDAAAITAAVIGLIGTASSAQDKFGIAVSGGPDSLSLLLLAAQAFPGRVQAATVDHGLRAEGAAEAAIVAHLCAGRNLPHATLIPSQPITGSLQAAARAVRYSLLEQWRIDHGLDWLMTAHHADDQLETLIMRINRGSSVGGLAGIRRRQGRVLRPLLGWRRDALAQWLAREGVEACDDPSNRNPQFDRARIRLQLTGQTLLDPLAVARSSAYLDDCDTALAWATEQLTEQRLHKDKDGLLLNTSALPPELRRRLLIRALFVLAPQQAAPRSEALLRAMAALDAEQTTTLGAVILRPATNRSGHWHLAKAPPRRHTHQAM